MHYTRARGSVRSVNGVNSKFDYNGHARIRIHDIIAIYWYNTIQCVELNVEDSPRHSNKTESVSLRKCPYDHRLTNKAYLSVITVTNIYQEFYLQDGGKNQLAWIWNKLRHCHPTYTDVDGQADGRTDREEAFP